MFNTPLFPAIEDPELNERHPLVPLVPEFEVERHTAPLLDAVPSPVLTTTTPPERTVLRPDAISKLPPTPLVPIPIVTLNAPPQPAVDASEPKFTHPVLPALELPELNMRRPLVPAMPAFDAAIWTSPLLDTVPSPLAKARQPPL